MIDNCSGLMPAVVVGIRHIGVFESALGDINFGICKQQRNQKSKTAIDRVKWFIVNLDTYAVALLMVAAENSTLVRLGLASESLNHGSYAPTETELQVFLEICAQVLAVKRVEHFERLSTCQNLLCRYGRLVARHQRVHAIYIKF